MNSIQRMTMSLPYASIAKHFDETRKAIWTSVGLFLDSLEPGTFIADVGCGNGKYTKYRKDIIVMSNDLTLELLETFDTGVHYDKVLANGLRLPYRVAIFDHAISIAVIHHIPTFKGRCGFLRNIVNTVKEGGYILFTVWAAEQSIKKKWIPLISNEKNDYHVPWLDKYSGQTFLRFYHLFDKVEVDGMLSALHESIHTVNITYERDNWVVCARVQRKRKCF